LADDFAALIADHFTAPAHASCRAPKTKPGPPAESFDDKRRRQFLAWMTAALQ